MKLTYILPLVCMVGLSGCATQGALDSVSNDVDTVKTRMFSVEKDLAGLREESKLSVSSVEKGFKSDVAAVRKMSADIQATIDSTKSEMQALNGKLDDTSVALKKLRAVRSSLTPCSSASAFSGSGCPDSMASR